MGGRANSWSGFNGHQWPILFRELFVALCVKRDMTLIGVYRKKPGGERYVYLYPEPDTVIHQDDELYVLRRPEI